MQWPSPVVTINHAGDKIRDGGDWCFGIVCEGCGKRQVHHARNIRRGVQGDYPVALLRESWLRCPLAEQFKPAPPECRADWVTVEDGCSEEG